MEYKKKIIIGLGVFIILGLALSFYTNSIKQNIAVSDKSIPSPTNPVKTDFGNKKPTDFPTNIPIEQNATTTQSYNLDYGTQKQLSIVFSTKKTIKQNYTLYADFLKKDGWNVINKYENANVSSLYATKENNDINITISKGQVSISVLKK